MLMATIFSSLPLLLAGIGGLFSEKTGKTNIALEGFLLAGAFTAIRIYAFVPNFLMAILGAVITCFILSWLLGQLTFRLKANFFITAAAFNIMLPGIISILLKNTGNQTGIIKISEPTILSNPAFSILLFVITLLFTGFLSVYLKKSHPGRLLNGTGSNPEYLRQLGYNPEKIQIISISLSGIFCGLGGAMLTLRLGVFVPGISAGKGWIALIAVIMGRKKPIPTAIAVLLFSMAETLANALQIIPDFPSDILLALPYVVTLAALILYAIISLYRKRRIKEILQ